MADRGIYTYDYPRPMVTVDAIVFRYIEDHLHVLMIKRGQEPYADCWAFPGGFMEMNETLKEAAIRELEEETGIRGVELIQIGAFDRVDRDPRGRNIGVAFTGIVREAIEEAKAGDDAAEAAWMPADGSVEMAFDHGEMLELARELVTSDTRFRSFTRGGEET